ncbi:MAG: UDP-2,3-diacylglucosamine diphosphatase [Candidatus Nanopelagicales bacterium]
MRARFRTVWISDTHLGTAGCRAEDLSRFLKQVECERLYLVGDIIDMWRLKARWHWPAEHNRVVRRLLKLAQRGTEITYIPGNHDDAARQFAGMEFGGVRIELTALHETADGRRLLVTHGDQFDLVVRHSPMLSRMGAVGYHGLLRLNRLWNSARSAFGLPYHSLSRAIKLKVKQACTFISRFEESLAEEARRAGFDGVVCGHIHKPDTRSIERAGASLERSATEKTIEYFNCGDWVESCSALVEHEDGRIEVIDAIAWMDRRLASVAVEPDDVEAWPDIPMPLPIPDRIGARGVGIG